MIYSLTVTDPKRTTVAHWHQVEWLKDKTTIEFKPGMNVIFGTNGTGKSTVITALAKEMHCYLHNWPRLSKSSVHEFLRPNGLADGMLVEHDGKPCRYLGINDMEFAPDNAKQKEITILQSSTGRKTLTQMSAGQSKVAKLARFLTKEPRGISKEVRLKGSDEWIELYEVATESLKNAKPRPGMPRQHTLLLDEVDSHLDFKRQAEVWAQLKELSYTNQIIIASHSPFALWVEGANYIETVPNYLEGARAALAVAMTPSPAA